MAVHGCGCRRPGCPECDPERSIPAGTGWGEPAPIPNDGPSMHDLVIDDMRSRKQFGLDKYGTPLQAGNGRDPLKDAYEEALDLVVYLRQELAERHAEVERHRQRMQIVRPFTTAEQAALDNDHLRRLLAGAVEVLRQANTDTEGWRAAAVQIDEAASLFLDSGQ